MPEHPTPRLSLTSSAQSFIDGLSDTGEIWTTLESLLLDPEVDGVRKFDGNHAPQFAGYRVLMDDTWLIPYVADPSGVVTVGKITQLSGL